MLMGNWVLGSVFVFITSTATALGLERVVKENLLEINGPINLSCIVACRNIKRKKRKIHSRAKNITLKIIYKPFIKH